MSFSSPGQLNHELAGQTYRLSRQFADTLVKLGRLPVSSRDAFFAKQVAEDFGRLGLKIPKHIATKAGISTVKATQTAVAPSAGAITSTVAKASIGQTLKGTIRGGAPVAATLFVGETALNARRYGKGQITGEEFRRRTAESAATNGGGLAGSAGGAAIGTMIFPGVGTVIGGIVGGLLGGLGSGKVMRKFTRKGS